MNSNNPEVHSTLSKYFLNNNLKVSTGISISPSNGISPNVSIDSGLGPNWRSMYTHVIYDIATQSYQPLDGAVDANFSYSNNEWNVDMNMQIQNSHLHISPQIMYHLDDSCILKVNLSDIYIYI